MVTGIPYAGSAIDEGEKYTYVKGAASTRFDRENTEYMHSLRLGFESQKKYRGTLEVIGDMVVTYPAQDKQTVDENGNVQDEEYPDVPVIPAKQGGERLKHQCHCCRQDMPNDTGGLIHNCSEGAMCNTCVQDYLYEKRYASDKIIYCPMCECNLAAIDLETQYQETSLSEKMEAVQLAEDEQQTHVSYCFRQCHHSVVIQKIPEGESRDIYCPECMSGELLIGGEGNQPEWIADLDTEVLKGVDDQGNNLDAYETLEHPETIERNEEPANKQPDLPMTIQFRELEVPESEGDAEYGDCELCYLPLTFEDKYLSQFIPCPNHVFCRGCLQSNLKSCLEDGRKKMCPGDSCDVQYTDDDIDTIMGDDVLRRRFYQKEKESAVGTSDELFLCPGEDCGEIGVRPELQEDELREECCQRCRKPISFIYQKGKRFGQITSKATKEDFAAYKFIKSQIKAGSMKLCPECKAPVEHKTGCHHMTCRCGYEFCWVCMNDWSGDVRGGYWKHKKCNLATGTTPFQVRKVEIPEFQPDNLPADRRKRCCIM
ncbi:IBR domain-containing protein [Parendozoicomonas haliclonae]|uniref:IBR domain protein n=2 Tax=Parendozoicomonas haliclonae TaxID=1960125 RepID=A0A1X7AJ11_9GAMM|nr:IBR domain protein [Parendozoicomonas haliclonae]